MAVTTSLPNLTTSFLVPGTSYYVRWVITIIVSQTVTIPLVYGAIQALREQSFTIGEDCPRTSYSPAQR